MTTTHPKPHVPINSIHVTEKAASKVKEFAARDGKDEFGQTLQQRIEKHAVDNEFKSFKDAANAYLFDQHMKRAAMKAKEDAAKELQKQRKLGLGPVTDRSQKTMTQARSVSQMSYDDLMREGLEELGIDA